MIIKNEKSITPLSGFYIIFKSSVQNEYNGIRGISHLLEHLLCKGIDHLMDVFEMYGIEYNAFTSNSEVVFYMTGLDTHVNKYKQQFLDNIIKIKITKEQFLTEKKIVIQEYMDFFNEQNNSHYQNLQRKLYNNYGPIGDLTDLKELDYDTLIQYYDDYFTVPDIIVNISQSNPFEVDESKYPKKHKENLKNISINIDPTFELLNSYKNKTSIIYNSDIVKDDFNTIQFICQMLNSGLNSPLYKIIREKHGLVYNVQMFLDKLDDERGIITISTITDNDNVKEVIKLLDEIITSPKTYLTEQRFKIIKESIKNNIILDKINNQDNIYPFLNTDDWNIENIIDTITLKQVYQIYMKYFKRWYKSIDKKEFEK